MKKLIAYSSVAHMAFVTFGLFAMNRQGIEGAIIVMLSHGLVSGALFLCVGVVYDRLHTRDIERYGGLADNMPGYALLFMVFTMASVGLPGTSGFVGEFLSLIGTYRRRPGARSSRRPESSSARPICSASIGGSALGRAHTPTPPRCPTCRPREWWLLGPIAAGVFWMGIYPESFMRPIRNDVGRLLDAARAGAPAGDSHLTLARRPHMDHGATTDGRFAAFARTDPVDRRDRS